MREIRPLVHATILTVLISASVFPLATYIGYWVTALLGLPPRQMYYIGGLCSAIALIACSAVFYIEKRSARH
ncbi:hypothetical protein DENIT_20082 [Pseudomonas veronii]|nr:hypothetical protein DENIT_20082 [Pseudomonas veronii]